jgi:bifunctional non-homologous end joining protein LigD
VAELTWRIDGQDVRISNPDKVLFPADGLTKRHLVEHYARCADLMLPHLADRPLTVRRFPDGISGEGWFQKHAPSHTPEWITRAEVASSGGGTVEHLVADRPATLVYLANLAAIELHAGLVSVGAPPEHRELVFDLDPPDGADSAVVRRATRRCRDLLSELEVPCLVKTSGSSGFHVHVPLVGGSDPDLAREVARAVAGLLARRHPDELTVEHRRNRRGDRVLIDWMRNSPRQTAVAPYSVRARDGAPVATPMDWEELAGTSPQRWTIPGIARRLAQRTPAWQDPVVPTDLHDVVPRLTEALEEPTPA